MFTKTLAALAAAALLAPAAEAGGLVHGTPVATPFVSPPPKLHRAMHWIHQALPMRALQGVESGPLVVGLESMRDLPALRARYGLRDVVAIPGLHAALIGGGAATFAQDPRVRYVSTTGPRRQLLHLRNDPLLFPVGSMLDAPYEWQFAAAHVDRALNISRGDPHILACTVDSGSADVPDLAGKVDARLWSTYPPGPTDGFDVNGHGTATASLIAANVDDGFGIAGFGGATHLITYRDEFLADDSIAMGIDKLRALGCRIINLSIGGPEPTSPILRDSIDKALVAGVLIVAASGNDGTDEPFYPADDLQPANGADSLGLAVGASDFAGSRARFSNYGANLSLLAPGDYDYSCAGGVLAAIPLKTTEYDGTCTSVFAGAGGARYAYVGGTSFSSPEVAGVAALVWAARPDLRNYQVADIIKRSAHRDGGWTPTAGYGVLDAAAALALPTGRSSADALALTDERVSASRTRVTATARATWNDGTALVQGTVTCPGAVASTFTSGLATCTWQRTKQRLRSQIAVEDPETGLRASAVVAG